MKRMNDIYQALLDGDRLTDEEVEAGFNHFTEMCALLRKSGAAFALAEHEATRMAGKLQLFVEVRKLEALNAERNSPSYQDGYQTGFTWKEKWTPGGPFHFHPKPYESAKNQAIAHATVVAHGRWVMGFKEGLADQHGVAPKAA